MLMVSIVTKNIKGRPYLYLVDSIRKGPRVIQKTVKYIGPKRPIPKEEFECMVLSYRGEDWILNDVKDELAYTQHHEMKRASSLYKQYFNQLDAVSKEKETQKFIGTFISSSNAIEGSTLTAKETFDFLFKDIVPKNHTKKELFMASNLLDAWNYVEKNQHRFPTHQDLRILHGLVNRNIESEETLGNYKHVQNYIGDVYTSSYLFIEEKMEKLLRWMRKAFREIDDFEVAFQSHAQFEIIHPFVDGNGRVGRLLINWLLLMKGLSPLAIHEKKRPDYINALENARNGKIQAIVQFFYGEYMMRYQFI